MSKKKVLSHATSWICTVLIVMNIYNMVETRIWLVSSGLYLLTNIPNYENLFSVILLSITIIATKGIIQFRQESVCLFIIIIGTIISFFNAYLGVTRLFDPLHFFRNLETKWNDKKDQIEISIIQYALNCSSFYGKYDSNQYLAKENIIPCCFDILAQNYSQDLQTNGLYSLATVLGSLIIVVQNILLI